VLDMDGSHGSAAAHAIKDKCLLAYTRTEALYNAADQDPSTTAVLGQFSPDIPKRRSVLSGSFASNPWRAGWIPPPLQCEVATDFETSLKSTSPDELQQLVPSASTLSSLKLY
jgi:hypothetical protein